MKTKIIPFDLETAAKIQAGEIEGRVFDRCNFEGTIITTKGVNTPLPVVVKFDFKDGDNILFFGYDGKNARGNCLVLEVPDIKTPFKVGDNVRIRPDSMHGSFVREYDGCIGKIVGTHHEFFVVMVTGAFQAQFRADELELVEETGKHEFKPFDKVLVRDCDEDEWHISFFSHMKYDWFITNNGHMYKCCIPYEGNEHLVGTTCNPKED